MRICTISRTTSTIAVVLVAACALLAGCSSSGTGEAKADAGNQQQVAVGLQTAEQVAATLEQSVSTMTTTVVYSASTDPDHLLGKAHGYLSRVAFSDSRVQSGDVAGNKPDDVQRGGTVETFATPAQAHARAKDIEGGSLGAMASGEYHYYVGGSLIRVSQILTPLQAQDYKSAAQKLN
jgi:hypothetical protein